VNRYVNPANAITVSRFAALPVFAWALARGHDQICMVALLFCAVLDLFDGAVARACNCASGFGEVLDAVTDAICYGFFILLLTWYGRLPTLPIVGILVLGLVNFAFRMVYARRAGRTTNFRSFAMERVVAFTVYLAAFGIAGYEPAFYSYGMLIVMAIVIAHDAKRMLVDPVPAEAGAPP
jgi:phosphatidylglycerophosphate synthase